MATASTRPTDTSSDRMMKEYFVKLFGEFSAIHKELELARKERRDLTFNHILPKIDQAKEESIESTRSMLGSVVDSITGVITGIFKSIKGLFTKLYSELRNSFKWVVDKIKSVFSFFFGQLKSILSGIKDFVFDIFSSIYGKIKSAFSWVMEKTGLSKVWEWIKKIGDYMTYFFVGMAMWKGWKAFASAKGSFWERLVQALKVTLIDLWDTFVAGFPEFIGKVLVWLGIADEGGKLVKGLNWMSDFLRRAGRWLITTGLDLIVQFFQWWVKPGGGWDMVKGWGKKIQEWYNFWTSPKGWSEKINEAFKALGEWVKSLLEWGGTLWTSFKTWWNAPDGGYAIFKGWWDTITKIGGDLWTSFANWWNTPGTGGLALITGWWESLLKIGSSLWTSITVWWEKTAWPWINKLMFDIFGENWTTLKRWVKDLKKWIGEVYDWFVEMYDWVTGEGWITLKSTWDRVVFFWNNELPVYKDKIVEFYKLVEEKVLKVKEDLEKLALWIHRLSHPIDSAGNWIGEKVSDATSGAKDLFKSAAVLGVKTYLKLSPWGAGMKFEERRSFNEEIKNNKETTKEVVKTQLSVLKSLSENLKNANTVGDVDKVIKEINDKMRGVQGGDIDALPGLINEAFSKRTKLLIESLNKERKAAKKKREDEISAEKSKLAEEARKSQEAKYKAIAEAAKVAEKEAEEKAAKEFMNKVTTKLTEWKTSFKNVMGIGKGIFDPKKTELTNVKFQKTSELLPLLTGLGFEKGDIISEEQARKTLGLPPLETNATVVDEKQKEREQTASTFIEHPVIQSLCQTVVSIHDSMGIVNDNVVTGISTVIKGRREKTPFTPVGTTTPLDQILRIV